MNYLVYYFSEHLFCLPSSLPGASLLSVPFCLALLRSLSLTNKRASLIPRCPNNSHSQPAGHIPDSIHAVRCCGCAHERHGLTHGLHLSLFLSASLFITLKFPFSTFCRKNLKISVRDWVWVFLRAASLLHLSASPLVALPSPCCGSSALFAASAVDETLMWRPLARPA